MPPASNNTGDPAPELPLRRRRKALRRFAWVLFGCLMCVSLLGWALREDIARDLIGEELARLGVPATYDVAEISPDRQVLTNIIIGDPANPDLTIERVEAELIYGLGPPELGRITLIKPRLFGSYRDGRLSFGALDTVVFAESDEPPGLPALDLALIDARGLLETDFGRIGWKAEGEGRLDSGFTGIIAATTPSLSIAGCRAAAPSLYGNISTQAGAISLDGPLRVPSLDCADAGVNARGAEFALDLTVASDFAKADVQAAALTRQFSGAGILAAQVSGPLRLSATQDGLTAAIDLQAGRLASGKLRAGKATIGAMLRMQNGYDTAQLQGDVAVTAIDAGAYLSGRLLPLQTSAEGTLLAPLFAKLDAAQQRQLRGARLNASFNMKAANGTISASVPQGSLRNASGGDIASFSRVEYQQSRSAQAKLSGNFRMGGNGLPLITGRMEQRGADDAIFRLKMQRYSAGDNWVELPELAVTQRGGAVQFTGNAAVSGMLPGGAMRNLAVPIEGSWSAARGLAIWNSCTTVRFDSLKFANLDLASRGLRLCPPPGGAIVRQSGDALRIAAGTGSLALNGSLGGTDIAVSSGAVAIAYPGVVKARDVTITLGADTQANRFAVSELTAMFDQTITGSFSGADIRLFAVPLDISGSCGEWSFNDAVLAVSDAAFTVSDREEVQRFEPLIARGASLVLQDNIVTANAVLRHPASGRAVSAVDMRHNLDSAAGFANLTASGLTFDNALQPDDLTYLAGGVVALVRGRVTGSGRIGWDADTLTSAGTFSSESLDFAAVFGPVRGASGTVEFVDLLSLTTAPDQEIYVASVNPGIEVLDGIIGFSLREGQFLGVTGGEWPFMGGTLTLKPVDLNLSAQEERRYVLEVEALDAALFVENMDIANLAATGIFDGSLPIVFDKEGFGAIVGGSLVSRAPGGNVAYVGELSYRDLSPMANYAFTTLRSLDYDTMRIGMDGALTGDIVTQVRFDGVKQGSGTKQNFITRQIADLPIRLNVNIRASFYELFTNLRTTYDPSSVRDPRDLGLMRDDGTRFIRRDAAPASAPARTPTPAPPSPPQIPPPDFIRSAEPSIQTSDSEELP
ncbi:intermembrane phospholipid transport protein YdbH family protein [Pontixanthobacter sp.]|uniref:intermembrane phospholipid transport protein YdbH family protein n=1 Tax=Pontixanthobacter sp. TaxID=2792078 RepID=UPI003C7A0A6B